MKNSNNLNYMVDTKEMDMEINTFKQGHRHRHGHDDGHRHKKKIAMITIIPSTIIIMIIAFLCGKNDNPIELFICKKN
jgi:hypothetical protein